MQHRKPNPLRRLIWRIAGVMFAVGILLVAIVLYSGRSMDEAALENERALIDNAFSSRLVRAVSEARSVAWWDEAVTKSSPTQFDQSWLDLEVGAFMTDSYKHDQILILDEQNRPVYQYGQLGRDNNAGLKAQLRATTSLITQTRGGSNASPRILDTRILLATAEKGAANNRRYGRAAAAILAVNGRPVMVSVMSITPSVDFSIEPKIPRLLVSFINMNPALLADIGNNTLLPDLKFSNGATRNSGRMTLDADTGRPIAQLEWTSKKPGSLMVRHVMPWIVGALLVASALLTLLLIKLNGSTVSLAQREFEAQHFANHDALTGLPNRRKLRADFEVLGSDPLSTAHAISMATINMDRFKDINDTLGHQAGDALIQAVAARIEDVLTPRDVLARLGGDELAVMRYYRTPNDGDALTSAIAACFDRPFPVIGHEIEVNASIGLVNVGLGADFNEIMQQADIALHEAKAQGRGRMVRFAAPMAEKLLKRHSLETDLRRALADQELTLNYQPIVEAQTGAIASVEALLRWTSPIHGSVPPDIFINIAEEAGIMAELGRFVIARAIEDAQKWPQFDTAINISPAQLRSVSLVSDLTSATKRYGVSPERITIEITETVLMTNDEWTHRVLAKLKACGFKLALDDFGTGYSSLSYLRDFPFDKLKIDRSFVQGLAVNDRALAIVKAVVNFGQILGRDIVAEGIETEQEMQAMQQAGCTHLQGFLFSRALPADHIEAMAATFGRLSARRASTLGPLQSVAPQQTKIRDLKAG